LERLKIVEMSGSMSFVLIVYLQQLDSNSHIVCLFLFYSGV